MRCCSELEGGKVDNKSRLVLIRTIEDALKREREQAEAKKKEEEEEKVTIRGCTLLTDELFSDSLSNLRSAFMPRSLPLQLSTGLSEASGLYV